ERLRTRGYRIRAYRERYRLARGRELSDGRGRPTALSGGGGWPFGAARLPPATGEDRAGARRFRLALRAHYGLAVGDPYPAIRELPPGWPGCEGCIQSSGGE